MHRSDNKIWDVAVIGGGPAGMMAAGTAAEKGASVILLEKNTTLGKKLLITGGGRCNVTNAIDDTRTLLSKFKGSDQFLFSAFAQWNVAETLDFFNARGMATKVEAEGRVFPRSNTAESVWNVLNAYLMEGKVTVAPTSIVEGFMKNEQGLNGVRLNNKRVVHSKTFVLATGGTSRPETGSTGDGFSWLTELGHSVIKSNPALVPVVVAEAWVRRLRGVSLPDIKLSVLQNGVKQESRRGKILFTHFGLSGPTILNMSKNIGELLTYGPVTLSFDLLPNLDYGVLNTRLLEILQREANKKFKNSLGSLLPGAFIPLIIERSGIVPDTWCHSITREERLRLVQVLKDIPVPVSGLLGRDKAVVTSGGVMLTEVNFKTMQSRLFPNLYLVGDILNIDRPSGGFSLQLCWTTGHVAGRNAAESVMNAH